MSACVCESAIGRALSSSRSTLAGLRGYLRECPAAEHGRHVVHDRACKERARQIIAFAVRGAERREQLDLAELGAPDADLAALPEKAVTQAAFSNQRRSLQTGAGE
jgi:hypothetical protein